MKVRAHKFSAAVSLVAVVFLWRQLKTHRAPSTEADVDTSPRQFWGFASVGWNMA